MYIEQRLETCGLCRCVLALQYAWYADRMPTWSRDRVLGRTMACPQCGYLNFFVLLMYAHGLQIKVVPGPQPWVPFPRLPTRQAAEPDRPPTDGRVHAVSATLFDAAQTYRRLEMLLAWFAHRLLSF